MRKQQEKRNKWQNYHDLKMRLKAKTTRKFFRINEFNKVAK